MPNEERTLSILRNIETLKSQKKVNYVIHALIEKGFVKAENEQLQYELVTMKENN